jgi:hypothetical protein
MDFEEFQGATMDVQMRQVLALVYYTSTSTIPHPPSHPVDKIDRSHSDVASLLPLATAVSFAVHGARPDVTVAVAEVRAARRHHGCLDHSSHRCSGSKAAVRAVF